MADIPLAYFEYGAEQITVIVNSHSVLIKNYEYEDVIPLKGSPSIMYATDRTYLVVAGGGPIGIVYLDGVDVGNEYEFTPTSDAAIEFDSNDTDIYISTSSQPVIKDWTLTYGSTTEYYDTLEEALDACPTDGTAASIYSEMPDGMSDIIVPEGANVTIELSKDDFYCDDISVPEGASLELTLLDGATFTAENDITCDGAFTFNVISSSTAIISNSVIVNESAAVNINIGNEDTSGDLYIYGDLSNYSSDFDIVATDGRMQIDGATSEYGHIRFDLQANIVLQEFYMYVSNTYDFVDSGVIAQLYVADGVTATFKTLDEYIYHIDSAYDMHGNELTPESHQEGDYYITKYEVAQPQTDITLDLSTVGLAPGTHSIQVSLSDDGATKADSPLSTAVSYEVSSPYDYDQDGDVLTITSAPYTQDDDNLIIG